MSVECTSFRTLSKTQPSGSTFLVRCRPPSVRLRLIFSPLRLSVTLLPFRPLDSSVVSSVPDVDIGIHVTLNVDVKTPEVGRVIWIGFSEPPLMRCPDAEVGNRRGCTEEGA